MRRAPARRAALVVALALFVAGCGAGDDDAADADRSTTEPTTADADKPEPEEDLYAGIDFSLLADLPGGDPVEEWVDLVDDAEILEITTTSAWDDVDLAVGEADGVDVPAIFAAPDLSSFSETYDDPGLKFLLYSQDIGDRDTVVATRRDLAALEDNCERSESFDYDDGLYLGVAELWLGCGDAGAAYLLVVAAPEVEDAGFELVLEVQMLDQTDVEVARTAIETFRFVGSAEDVPVRPDAGPTTAAPTTADTIPDEERPIGDADRVVAIVTDHLRGCGMGRDWASADLIGGNLWEVSVWIEPPGPAGENGDPGEGRYLVDIETREVTSTNGTADVLCPG